MTDRQSHRDDPPDRYAVVGQPVAHSQSPFIHAEFARQTGQHLVYTRVECPSAALAACLQSFVAGAPGDGPARGCNVTVPLKFEAVELAARISPRAALAQAGNVLMLDQPGWACDNTDGLGLVHDIQSGAGVDLTGRQVLLIGAGGAAAGVLGPLLEARPNRLMVANRTPERAQVLARRHQKLASEQGVDLVSSGLDNLDRAWDVVINASASSLHGGQLPLSAAVLKAGTLAVDLMYGPLARPFMDWARSHGAHGRDGLGMLVEQAAHAFQLWRHLRPATAPVLQVLRKRLAPN